MDDGLICSNNKEITKRLLRKLESNFKIKYNKAEYFIGIQIERDRSLGVLKLHQTAYAQKILSKFFHTDCAPSSVPADPGMKFIANNGEDESNCFPYREALGSIMYLMVTTRPDLAYIISVLSQFASKPNKIHWNGIKLVLHYIKGIMPWHCIWHWKQRLKNYWLL